MNPLHTVCPHGRSHPARIVVLLVGACVFLSGCATLQSVPVPGAGATTSDLPVHVGDEVRVVMKGGETVLFTITAIESDALVGKTARIKYDQISSLQIRHPQSPTGVSVGTGVVILAIAVVIIGALAHAGP